MHCSEKDQLHLRARGFAGPYGEHGRLGNVLRLRNGSQVMTPECNACSVPTDAACKHAAAFGGSVKICIWEQLAAHRGLNLALFLATHALGHLGCHHACTPEQGPSHSLVC